jgi:hypothetical protein
MMSIAVANKEDVDTKWQSSSRLLELVNPFIS